MLLNYETVLVGDKCVLVPYRKDHVARYHEWMQDLQLLEATASEPLSLDQEYEMQSSWRDDSDKCTFIVLDRQAVDETLLEKCLKESAEDCSESSDISSRSFIHNSLSAMAGDVNMFLSDEESDEEEAVVHEEKPRKQAEIDIMIAQGEHRRKGLGREATCLMMLYGAKQLHLRRIFCKINEDNEASLQLFKSLGFVQCAYAECFREVELELKCEGTTELIHALEGLLGWTGEIRSFQCPIMENII